MRKDKHNILQRGSLMVEALALLGIITMVTPVMYKKAAERTTELQDINTATQIRTINEALDNYVRNNYSELKTGISAGNKKVISMADATKEDATAENKKFIQDVSAFLPSGFDLTKSKFLNTNGIQFAIEHKQDAAGKSIFTSAVMVPTLGDVSQSRASKIASMIGVNGDAYNQASGKFEGTQGAWSAETNWFDIAEGGVPKGTLMSISSEAISEAAQMDNSKVLYREDVGDPSKNTMRTNLIMDGHNIDDISTLFGSGGTLTIGSDINNGNLAVKGTLNVYNSANITGMLTVIGDTQLQKLLAGDTTLKKTTVDGTLGVTGDTTLKNTTVGGTLGVTGDTTVGGTLQVGNITGDIHRKLEVWTGTNEGEGLDVYGNTTFHSNVGVNGTLTSNSLHAKQRLTVGGEDSSDPNILDVSEELFDVAIGNANIKITDSDGTSDIIMVSHTDSDGNYDAQMKISENSIKMETNDALIDMSYHGGSSGGQILRIGNKKDSFSTQGLKLFDNGNTSLQSGGVYAGALSLGIKSAQLKASYKDEHGGTSSTILNLGDNSASLIVESGAAFKATGKDFKIHNVGENVSIFTANDANDKLIITAKNENETANVVIDPYGMSVGATGMAGSYGNRTASADRLDPTSSNKVIISRKGFIEIAPPSDESKNGNEAGFIRARRLVSDIKYPGNGFSDDFDGYTAKGGDPSNGYDYYQVNPAYTSVMNDIKLASRGGARLSDILPDYVVKGIYVADNTYHDASVPNHIKNIVIDNGEVQASWTEASTNGPTSGEIKECTNSKCPASPWLGFVPRPQCPKGYAAVITLHPFRWRMSEVYYLNDPNDQDDLNRNWIGNIPNVADRVKVMGGKNIKENGNTDGEAPYNYLYEYNDPRVNPITISQYTPTDEDTKHIHTHEITGRPYQINTWLNTSPLARTESYDDDGNPQGVPFGWDVMLGFLYRHNDYIEIFGAEGGEAEDVYWNLFPSYAQELAAAVTTYCAFTRKDLSNDTFLYGAGNVNVNVNSPVLNYDQLNQDTYRDPRGYSREPASQPQNTDGAGSKWSGAVNDPSLNYDDAW